MDTIPENLNINKDHIKREKELKYYTFFPFWHQSDKVDKLEADNQRFKEKLRDLDYFKKRSEVSEQHFKTFCSWRLVYIKCKCHYSYVVGIHLPMCLCIYFFQELKEQNELLYDTKVVLEEQLTGLNTKEERIGERISMAWVVRNIFAQVLTSDYFNGHFN